jgi:RimJ/RimL family protein N-acetyltransferase
MTNPELQATPERVVLKSDNDTVQLMQLVPQDADDYFVLIAQDPAHLRQHGDETADKYPTPDAVRDSIVHPKNPAKYRFGIWDNGVMVGSNNLTPEDNGRAELGSWVGKEHIGQGYAGRARALLVDFAFNRLGFDEVYCDIVVGNEPSKRSVEKSGFALTGDFVDDEGVHKWRYVLRRQSQ